MTWEEISGTVVRSLLKGFANELRDHHPWCLAAPLDLQILSFSMLGPYSRYAPMCYSGKDFSADSEEQRIL